HGSTLTTRPSPAHVTRTEYWASHSNQADLPMDPREFGNYLLERERSPRTGESRIFFATLKVDPTRRLLVETVHDPERALALAESAKALVGLRHPRLAPVYEVGLARGVCFASMEHVDGALLADLPHLAPDEGAHVGAEIWRGLEYARREKKIALEEVRAD